MKVETRKILDNGEEKTVIVKRKYDPVLDAQEINEAVKIVQGDHDHGKASYLITEKGGLRLVFEKYGPDTAKLR